MRDLSQNKKLSIKYGSLFGYKGLQKNIVLYDCAYKYVVSDLKGDK